ncbi:hypothetical protein BCR43DRAFT_509176 [Syncephalastrum racemosum]|uniref:Inhibitor I9 domain-containing protein n=1 Tax=Syncephalastrum racemosum TaxID=13706 RepID=A0A1X2GZN6_SYNRA|nr:hypothetical protein BCR43DRAFT_509176 [Syncephalastrum racemosum]
MATVQGEEVNYPPEGIQVIVILSISFFHHFTPRTMPSRYRILFKNDTPGDVAEEHFKQAKSSGATIKGRYDTDSVMFGYSFETHDDDPFLEECVNDPNISSIEPDEELVAR